MGRKEEIDDLIAAFDRVVHEDHPNPERAGCPGRPALTALAKDSKPLGSDSLLEHIRHCAACLDELKELRMAMNPRGDSELGDHAAPLTFMATELNAPDNAIQECERHSRRAGFPVSISALPRSPFLDSSRIADNRGVEPGGLRRLVNLKGWAARQHP